MLDEHAANVAHRMAKFFAVPTAGTRHRRVGAVISGTRNVHAPIRPGAIVREPRPEVDLPLHWVGRDGAFMRIALDYDRRVPRPLRSMVRGPALSLVSQLVGLAQLFALLWRHGPSGATDAYFYLFNLGLLPTQVGIVGVLYPMLLSQDRISRSGAVLVGRIAVAGAVTATLAGSLWLGFAGRLPMSLYALVAMGALNAAFQARLFHRAVLAEASGTPQWMAAVALPANALATFVLLAPWPTSTAAATAMMGALVVGNGVFLVYVTRQRLGAEVLAALPTSRVSGHHGPAWFLTKSGVGYGGLMVLQSLAVLLPPSTLTLLSLAIKLVGSVSSTFVNAVMPLLVHQSTESPAEGRRFIRVLVVVLGVGGLAASGVVTLVWPQQGAPSLVLAMWLIAAAAAAVAQRMAFRFLPPHASRVTIVAVPVVVALAAVSSRSSNFDLSVLLCAYAGVDAATSFLLLAALRDRFMTIVSGAVLVTLSAVWLVGVM